MTCAHAKIEHPWGGKSAVCGRGRLGESMNMLNYRVPSFYTSHALVKDIGGTGRHNRTRVAVSHLCARSAPMNGRHRMARLIDGTFRFARIALRLCIPRCPTSSRCLVIARYGSSTRWSISIHVLCTPVIPVQNKSRSCCVVVALSYRRVLHGTAVLFSSPRCFIPCVGRGNSDVPQDD